jgi:hypothetical protein
MQVQYDPNVIGAAAAKLYQRAAALALTCGLLGGFSAAIFFAIIAAALSPGDIRTTAMLVGVGIGGIVGGAAGVVVGRTRAFLLRLEAQRMLVLVQIEMNTRRPS